MVGLGGVGETAVIDRQQIGRHQGIEQCLELEGAYAKRPWARSSVVMGAFLSAVNTSNRTPASMAKGG